MMSPSTDSGEKDDGSKGQLKNMSYAFAVRTVNMVRYLQEEKKECVLSKQVLRSGTAIGALVREAEYAQSPADFVHKLSISLKEANETDYWLSLLHDTKYLSDEAYNSMRDDNAHIMAMLVASVKTLKRKLAK